MTKEEKKEALEEMLKAVEDLDDIKKAQVMGYVKGMADANQMQKQKQAS